MNIMELGAIGELVGGFAVIASLVFVGFQVRHNTRSIRAATFQEAMRDVMTSTDMAISDPEWTRIWFGGLEDLDSLSPDERRRFGLGMVGFWRRIENVVYQTEQGVLERDAWEGLREALKRILSHPGAAAWWRVSDHAFNRSLREFVERELLAPSGVQGNASRQRD